MAVGTSTRAETTVRVMPEVAVAQLEIIRNLEKYIDTGCFADYRSFIKAVDHDIAIPYDHKRMARSVAQHLMFYGGW